MPSSFLSPARSGGRFVERFADRLAGRFAVDARRPAIPTIASRPHAPFEVASVDFAYRPGHPVFTGLDLSVAEGEFVVLIGPSGCGKTTLLNLLSGFARPQRGSVRLRGRVVKAGSPELGYVFQSPNLFAW